jgi:hypothetical protein
LKEGGDGRGCVRGGWCVHRHGDLFEPGELMISGKV